MKLVEILARDLKAWPKNHRGNDGITQDKGGNLNSLDTGCEPSFCYSYGCWEACSHSYLGKTLEEGEDFATAVVTKKQWQAERDRQKGGEWKRHRGGKCPVPAGTKVSTRHRNGEVVDVHFHTATTGSGPATMNTIWKHTGDDHDIMQYKVISQPQAEEVEVNVFVGKDVKIEYAYAQEGVEPEHLEWKTMGTAKIDSICDLGSTEAKTDQIDGPIKWRDTVNELDAYIEEFTRERESLINRLAEEGFALLPAMTAVMGVADKFTLMNGDIVRCVETNLSCADLTIGREYTICTRDGDLGVIDDEGDHMLGCKDSGELEFVRRP